MYLYLKLTLFLFSLTYAIWSLFKVTGIQYPYITTKKLYTKVWSTRK